MVHHTKESAFFNYQKLENDLKAFIPEFRFSKDINLKLERIVHLLDLLKNPQKFFKTIHVGGTSGKGSTATFISSILVAQGYKTGLHLSPHLQILNERYQINSQYVATSKISKIFDHIKPFIIEVATKNPFGSPSYFEIQVAIAFCLFESEKVDVAVIEVGLGGRLDATNVLLSEVSVLTSVGLDHTDILGNTVEEIASDKVCIIKNGKKVVSGFTQESTKQIIKEKADEMHSSLLQLGKDFTFDVKQDEISVIVHNRRYDHLKLQMKGEFQFANAACAVAAVHSFCEGNITSSIVRKGLLNATIAGRMEILYKKPTIVIDGAHNPDKIAAASKTVNNMFTDIPKHIVFSLKDGKDAKEIISHITKIASSIIFTEFYIKELWKPMLAAELYEIAKQLNSNVSLFIVKDPIEATKFALSKAKADEVIWITGSLYLVGDIREYWYPSDEQIFNLEINND